MKPNLDQRGGRWAFLLSVLILGGSGCSVQRLAVGTMVPVMEASLSEAYSSQDVETAREAIPGQLLLLRGLCQSDPSRIELWTTVVQLYASYAMTFVEDEDPERAARLYAEGLDLGRRYLDRIDWFARSWAEGPDALQAALADRKPVDLSPIIMWTGACLGQTIMANVDDPRVLADLPYVHVLADAALALTPDYFYGMPSVLKAILLSKTPRMLGGDPEKSQQLFDRAFAVSGRRYLYHLVLYAKYHCVATLDEEAFTAALEEVLAAPDDLFPEAQLINMMAKAQAAILLEDRDYLF